MGVKLLYYLLIVTLSLFIGYMIHKNFGHKKYAGDICVTEKDGMTLYSLELNGNPDEIKTKKEVMFKIVISSEESDRE